MKHTRRAAEPFSVGAFRIGKFSILSFVPSSACHPMIISPFTVWVLDEMSLKTHQHDKFLSALAFSFTSGCALKV